MKLLSLLTIIAVAINANPCIHSYPDSIIGYISNNINIDSSIYYLGNKESTNKCQNSCINLNYLCNTSSNHILFNENDASDWHFNNTECSITASTPPGDVGSGALLTQDLISNEYIIELQLSVLSEYEGGIMFKAKNEYDIHYTDYYFGVDVSNSRLGTASDQGGSYNTLNFKSTSSTITYNTKYNMSVHVIGTTFTTFFNGDEIYNHAIDESIWTQSYAGIYGWESDVIFHSFKVIFPNNTHNEDQRLCAAYIYDKNNGGCYGYYGDDYTVIETSVSVQSDHDSAVLYPSTTCAPTSNNNTLLPSNDTASTTSDYSTDIPSIIPSKQPTNIPSVDPINIPIMSTEHPTISSSKQPTDIPTVDGMNISLLSTHILLETMETNASIDEQISNNIKNKDVLNKLFSNRLALILLVCIVFLTMVIVLIICIFGVMCLRNKKEIKKENIELYTIDSVDKEQENEQREGSLHEVERMDIQISDVKSKGSHWNDTNVGSVIVTDDGNFNIQDDEFIVQGDDEITEVTKY